MSNTIDTESTTTTMTTTISIDQYNDQPIRIYFKNYLQKDMVVNIQIDKVENTGKFMGRLTFDGVLYVGSQQNSKHLAKACVYLKIIHAKGHIDKIESYKKLYHNDKIQTPFFYLHQISTDLNFTKDVITSFVPSDGNNTFRLTATIGSEKFESILTSKSTDQKHIKNKIAMDILEKASLNSEKSRDYLLLLSKNVFIKGVPVKIREDHNHEFKGAVDPQGVVQLSKLNDINFKRILITNVVSFLNSSGGSLYVGIHDSGIVQGIEFPNRDSVDQAKLDLQTFFKANIMPDGAPLIVNVFIHNVISENYIKRPSLVGINDEVLNYIKYLEKIVNLDTTDKPTEKELIIVEIRCNTGVEENGIRTTYTVNGEDDYTYTRQNALNSKYTTSSVAKGQKALPNTAQKTNSITTTKLSNKISPDSSTLTPTKSSTSTSSPAISTSIKSIRAKGSITHIPKDTSNTNNNSNKKRNNRNLNQLKNKNTLKYFELI